MSPNMLMKFMTVTLTIYLAAASLEEQHLKPRPIHKLCGQDFINTWSDCCEYGYSGCGNGITSEGQVEALRKRGK